MASCEVVSVCGLCQALFVLPARGGGGGTSCDGTGGRPDASQPAALVCCRSGGTDGALAAGGGGGVVRVLRCDALGPWARASALCAGEWRVSGGAACRVGGGGGCGGVAVTAPPPAPSFCRGASASASLGPGAPNTLALAGTAAGLRGTASAAPALGWPRGRALGAGRGAATGSGALFAADATAGAGSGDAPAMRCCGAAGAPADL
mmetsp:Transcript_22956/g.61244  ORF Transcript_22956/g.61244 Transcript_22956/m.61244 type:complete len:206 (-) Transcript_22956:191-808(-)